MSSPRRSRPPKLKRIHSRYHNPEPGEWIQPVRRGYRLACCDCGLTHTLNFRVHNGRVQFAVFRNNRATAVMRRRPHTHTAK